MVQVINDPYSGNVFGRIGKGIGQGLSEQVPKEIERTRLSSGLKKFEKEAQNLTPLQQFTKLAGIPGITPEHLYTIVPLLRQQAQRQEGEKGAGTPEINSAQSMPGIKGANAEMSPRGKEGIPSLKSIEATQAQLTPIVEKSQQQLYDEAVRLSKERPFTYPTPSDALAFVAGEEKTRISNLQEQRRIGDVADVIGTRLKAGLETRWGKEGTERGIPTTIQTKLARNLEAELADPNNRLSEQQLLDKYGNIGKRIAQAKTNLDTRAKLGPLTSVDYSPKKNLATIKEARKVYEEAEALEEFQDQLSADFNFSRGVAAQLAMPPQNKEANSLISKAPKPFTNEFGVSFPGEGDRITSELTDKIFPLLTENDNILSYAQEIRKAGLNPEAFMNRLSELDSQQHILNDRQRKELQTRLPRFPAPGDILYQS